MAVTEVLISSAGGSGDASGTASATAKRSYTVTYRVIVDDPLDEAQVVLDHFRQTPDLPWMGRKYKYANGRSSSEICRGVVARRLDKFLQFDVEARYEPLDGGGEDGKANPTTGTTAGGKESEDPSLWRYEIEESFYTITKPVEAATFRNAINADKLSPFLKADTRIAVVNSAWTAFDPPLEEEEHILVTRISQYVKQHSLELSDVYHGSVNDDKFEINLPAYNYRRGFDPLTVLIKTAQQLVEINGGFWWRRSIELHTNKLTWRRPVLDRGFSELVKAGDRDPRTGAIISPSELPQVGHENRAITDNEGNRAVEPVLLDGSGKALALNKSPVYLVYSTKPERPFAPLAGVAW